MLEYTTEDVAAHKTRDDLWVIVHSKVYDVTKYVRDHPGGVDVLIDVAGTDATAAYEDVGHSEDANEILQEYLIGTLKDAHEFKRKAAVRVIQQTPQQISTEKSSSGIRTVTVAASSLGGLFSLYFASSRLASSQTLREVLAKLPHVSPLLPTAVTDIRLPHGGFVNGFAAAALIFTAVGSLIGVKLSKLTQVESGFTKYPIHIKSHQVAKPSPHFNPGFLHPKEYKNLPLVHKDLLAPNVYRFVFLLPNPTDVIGLPIGQHVAIKATINGQPVSRSYTPTSNNLDLGRLELVIKCYPDGLLTGQYLANLNVGDKVQFRGPKGAMKYKQGLCKQIGMIAGGTGITPMYQLIRAICEDDTDTTEISLIYANRNEEDILLRKELEAFAANYPKNFKVFYMLDNPPQKWAYGKGYVTSTVMADKLPRPTPDTRIMLCGPPGMINAAKKGLVSLGFQAPGTVTKMTDQIFCF
ncbi:putative cytochrome b5 reductase [Talaromyces proteolyticus]|uniref:Cytochrome b5 reductase n=1 Tax=Talaromyces proteolyticus TaxID=1131652 RepID=A0AAD4KN72_9EURO|nr:putative cytochrome b5 reductase [Talaromyces proteolyticus]KAH8695416.1 putative cytochrome b5 reductase [Talaromyces proteolyticus]